jgi:hypothetical protein
MTLLLKKHANTVLIILTVPLILFLLCRLLLALLAAFTVSLCEFYFCRPIRKPRKPNRFFAALGVEHAQRKQDQFRFRRAAFYFQLKSKRCDTVVSSD